MKLSKLLKQWVLPISLMCGIANAVTYENFIVETHFDENGDEIAPVVFHEYLEDSGNIESGNTLEDGHRLLFELIAVRTDQIETDQSIKNQGGFTEYRLGEQVVWGDSPQAEITITSEDPYTVNPRTRADKPLFVTYTVKNLLPLTDEMTDIKMAKALHVFKHAGNTFKIETVNENMTKELVEYMPLDLITNRGDAYTTYGRVNFSMLEYLDENTFSQSDYDSASIKVLRKFKGTLTGVEEGETYNKLPTMQCIVENTYPDSECKILVFRGRIGNEVTIGDPFTAAIQPTATITAAKNLSNRSLTQEFSRTLAEDIVTKDGDWTLAFVHSTDQWGDELIDIKRFKYKTTLEVRSNISTSN